MDPVAALQIEVVVVAAFTLAAVLMLAAVRPSARRAAWVVGALVVAGSLGIAALTARRTGDRAMDRLSVLQEIPRLGRPDDGFVGAAACRSCHPGEHASWHGSWHRTMTQVATPDTVTGDFGDVTLVTRGRTTRLERRGDGFHAITTDPDWELQRYLLKIDPDTAGEAPLVDARVVMTTGAHHYQSYWIPSQAGNTLVNFHWAWMHETQEWIPREAAFLRPPDAPRLQQVWNNSCIHCHSTDGAEGVVEAMDGGFAFATSVAELGISCEACHGPGEAHVAINRDPLRRTRYRLDQAAHDPSIVHPQRIDPGRSNAVCAQCHSLSMPKRVQADAGRRFRAGETLDETRVLIRGTESKYETEAERAAWRAARDFLEHEEPGYFASRFWSDGMIRVTSLDYSAMIESPCMTDPAFSCLSCHSMHDYSAPADMLRTDVAGDGQCLQCHEAIGADAPALAAHTRHPVAGPAADFSPSCIDCHMPRTTYGLLKSVHSHEISSPSAAVAQATGRPDACSLCHADRTLAWTAEQLELGWGVAPPERLSPDEERLAAAVRWAIAGDAGQRALIADHLDDPKVQAAAGTEAWAAPLLARLLDDPYDAVRYIAARSYRGLTGDALADWSLMADPADRAAASAARLASAEGAAISTEGRPNWRTPEGLAAILRTALGSFDAEAMARLAAGRDDRPIELRE